MYQIKSFVRQFIVIVIVATVFRGISAKPPVPVVGGEDGTIGEFPYTAAVFKKNLQICGATIIGKRHVLTAAHCFYGVSDDPSKEMSIVTGTNVILKGAGNRKTIKLVTIHPEYSNKSDDLWKNDIAVVSLTEDIVFDVFSKPLLLPDEDTPGNWKCVASGWGDMWYPKGLQPVNVRKLVMTTMSNDDCRKIARRVDIFDTQLCTLQVAGQGLCIGDSGGPLVHNGTIVGIASFVVPCARGLVPDVFTRVYSYLDFIREAIEST